MKQLKVLKQEKPLEGKPREVGSLDQVTVDYFSQCENVVDSKIRPFVNRSVVSLMQPALIKEMKNCTIWTGVIQGVITLGAIFFFYKQQIDASATKIEGLYNKQIDASATKIEGLYNKQIDASALKMTVFQTKIIDFLKKELNKHVSSLRGVAKTRDDRDDKSCKDDLSEVKLYMKKTD